MPFNNICIIKIFFKFEIALNKGKLHSIICWEIIHIHYIFHFVRWEEAISACLMIKTLGISIPMVSSNSYTISNRELYL